MDRVHKRLLQVLLENYMYTYARRGVHSSNWVDFGRVSFGSITFWIHVVAGQTRVGTIFYGSIEDRLLKLSGLHRFDVDFELSINRSRVFIG